MNFYECCDLTKKTNLRNNFLFYFFSFFSILQQAESNCACLLISDLYLRGKLTPTERVHSLFLKIYKCKRFFSLAREQTNAGYVHRKRLKLLKIRDQFWIFFVRLCTYFLCFGLGTKLYNSQHINKPFKCQGHSGGEAKHLPNIIIPIE